MNPTSDQSLPTFFPLIILGGWFAITTILGYFSGWYTLMREFPDCDEQLVKRWRNQSGRFGSVSMSNILKFEVCTSGLRIGISRMFGPFCKNIFVPWKSLSVTRSQNGFWIYALLCFGSSNCKELKIEARLANQLARASGDNWPEKGSFAEESHADTRNRIFRQWLWVTTIAAAFFTVAPMIATQNANVRPPILVAILFPAIVFGVSSVIRYFRERE